MRCRHHADQRAALHAEGAEGSDEIINGSRPASLTQTAISLRLSQSLSESQHASSTQDRSFHNDIALDLQDFDGCSELQTSKQTEDKSAGLQTSNLFQRLTVAVLDLQGVDEEAGAVPREVDHDQCQSTIRSDDSSESPQQYLHQQSVSKEGEIQSGKNADHGHIRPEEVQSSLETPSNLHRHATARYMDLFAHLAEAQKGLGKEKTDAGC